MDKGRGVRHLSTKSGQFGVLFLETFPKLFASVSGISLNPNCFITVLKNLSIQLEVRDSFWNIWVVNNLKEDKTIQNYFSTGQSVSPSSEPNWHQRRMRCPVHTEYYILQCLLYIIHYTLYSEECRVNIWNCTLYTVHCTVHCLFTQLFQPTATALPLFTWFIPWTMSREHSNTV